MMKYAIIENGEVIGFEFAESDAAQEGWVEAGDDVQIGWLYSDEVFTAPVIKRFAVVHNGVVVNTVLAAKAMQHNWRECTDSVAIGYLEDGDGFTAPPVVQSPAEPVTRIITRLAFRNRFTFLERVAIETAAQTDVAVRVLLKDMEAAQYVDLDYGPTIEGLGLLTASGLISAARQQQILNAAVQSFEQ